MLYSIVRDGKEIKLTYRELTQIWDMYTSSVNSNILYDELENLVDMGSITEKESEQVQDYFDNVLQDFEDRLAYQRASDGEVAYWAIMEALEHIRNGETDKIHECRKDYTFITDDWSDEE